MSNERFYTYTAVKRAGNGGREWMIVNGNSGCHEYFTGTKTEANKRAAAVTAQKTAAWLAAGGKP